MALKGIKVNGTTYQYDYNYLANKPSIPNIPAASQSEGYVLGINDQSEVDWIEQSGGGGASLPSTQNLTKNAFLVYNDADSEEAWFYASSGSGNCLLTSSNNGQLSWTQLASIEGSTGEGGSGEGLPDTESLSNDAALIYSNDTGELMWASPSQGHGGTLVLTADNEGVISWQENSGLPELPTLLSDHGTVGGVVGFFCESGGSAGEPDWILTSMTGSDEGYGHYYLASDQGIISWEHVGGALPEIVLDNDFGAYSDEYTGGVVTFYGLGSSANDFTPEWTTIPASSSGLGHFYLDYEDGTISWQQVSDLGGGSVPTTDSMGSVLSDYGWVTVGSTSGTYQLVFADGSVAWSSDGIIPITYSEDWLLTSSSNLGLHWINPIPTCSTDGWILVSGTDGNHWADPATILQS